MEERSHLVRRPVSVRGHFRGGVYVHPYTAQRLVAEGWERLTQFLHTDNEELTKDVRQTFKNFRELVDRYNRKRHALQDQLAQYLPTEYHASWLPYVTRESYLPFTLFFLAPILPDDDRRVVEAAMHAYASCMHDAITLQLREASEPLTGPKGISALRAAERQLRELWAEFPASASPNQFTHAELGGRIANLWRIFSESANPDIRQHAEETFALIPLTVLADVIERTRWDIEHSIGQCYCANGIRAICHGIAHATSLPLRIQHDDEKTRKRISEVECNVVAAMTRMYALLADAAVKKATAGTDYKPEDVAHLVILAYTLNHLAQDIEREMQKGVVDDETFFYRDVPCRLVQHLIDSTYEHFKEPHPDSESYRGDYGKSDAFLDYITEYLCDEDEWRDDIIRCAQDDDDTVKEALALGGMRDELREVVLTHIQEMRHAAREDIHLKRRFLEAIMSYRMGGGAITPLWREYVQPIVQKVVEYCRELFDKGYTMEDRVRRVHPMLCELFGGESYECDTEVPPEYEERITILSKGLAIALRNLRAAAMGKLPKEIASQLPEYTEEVRRLQTELAAAMREAIAHKMTQADAASMPIQTLVSNALTAVLSPKVLTEQLGMLKVPKEYEPIARAVVAITKLRKRNPQMTDEELKRQVGDKMWSDYEKRHVLPAEEQTEEAIEAYAKRYLAAVGEYEKRRREVVDKLAAVIRETIGEEGMDYAYFIAYYAHNALGLVKGEEDLEEKERIRKTHAQLREGIPLRGRPMKLRIAWDYSAFDRLGYYGPDGGSCFREGRGHALDRIRLALHHYGGAETFVATLNTPHGEGHCVARLFGVIWQEGSKYRLYLTNVYDGGNRAFGRALVNATADAFARRLNAIKEGPHPMSSYKPFERKIYQNGDGVVYALIPKEIT